MNQPYIWAHRGASGYEKDNTLESFELAIKMGADGLESDVYLTKDHELVFFHDDTIPFNGKNYRLTELTTAQIQSVDLGKGRRVPKVRDIFYHFKDQKNHSGNPIRFSLDLKTMNMGDDLVRLAKQIGISSRVEITANDNYPTFWNKMKQWRTMNPEIQLVNSAHFQMKGIRRIFGKMYDQNWSKYHELGVKAINIQAKHASPPVISQVHQQNIQMYVWDCHTEEKIQYFFNQGVDGIYTNYPDLAVKLRQQN